MKKSISFFIFLIMGILSGVILTEVANLYPFLNFLTIGKSIGVGYPNPFTLDLSIIKLTLGFSIHLNLATVICIMLSLILYKKIGK